MNTELLSTKMHDVQRAIAVRGTNAKSSVQESMQTKPMLWAGIAAGAGFGIGLVGRFIHWRNKRRGSMPTLVVIETNC